MCETLRGKLGNAYKQIQIPSRRLVIKTHAAELVQQELVHLTGALKVVYD